MDELRQASADLQSDPYDALQDAYSAICAAHSALRSMNGVIETSLDEDDSYRFEDLSGDLYCIRHALQLFEAVIHANGLKGDGIKWRI
jgi:hypothetical protein